MPKVYFDLNIHQQQDKAAMVGSDGLCTATAQRLPPTSPTTSMMSPTFSSSSSSFWGR